MGRFLSLVIPRNDIYVGGWSISRLRASSGNGILDRNNRKLKNFCALQTVSVFSRWRPNGTVHRSMDTLGVPGRKLFLCWHKFHKFISFAIIELHTDARTRALSWMCWRPASTYLLEINYSCTRLSSAAKHCCFHLVDLRAECASLFPAIKWSFGGHQIRTFPISGPTIVEDKRESSSATNRKK